MSFDYLHRMSEQVWNISDDLLVGLLLKCWSEIERVKRSGRGFDIMALSSRTSTEEAFFQVIDKANYSAGRWLSAKIVLLDGFNTEDVEDSVRESASHVLSNLRAAREKYESEMKDRPSFSPVNTGQKYEQAKFAVQMTAFFLESSTSKIREDLQNLSRRLREVAFAQQRQ